MQLSQGSKSLLSLANKAYAGKVNINSLCGE
jgi:hypothetical protein